MIGKATEIKRRATLGDDEASVAALDAESDLLLHRLPIVLVLVHHESNLPGPSS